MITLTNTNIANKQKIETLRALVAAEKEKNSLLAQVTKDPNVDLGYMKREIDDIEDETQRLTPVDMETDDELNTDAVRSLVYNSVKEEEISFLKNKIMAETSDDDKICFELKDALEKLKSEELDDETRARLIYCIEQSNKMLTDTIQNNYFSMKIGYLVSEETFNRDEDFV